MSALLSVSKASALLTRVQLNPEIGTNNAAYVADLIQRASEDLVSEARLPRYPELSQGYSLSNTGASTDIESLATEEFQISANGSGYEIISITLSGLTTGDLIATEMQTAIQAGASDSFDEITVAFDTDHYTITSGRYGEDSDVFIVFDETSKHVVQALKLSPTYGGTEVSGMAARDEADDFVVEAVEVMYRKIGLEGIESGSVPGDLSFKMYADELTPKAKRIVRNMRRVFV